MRRQIGFVDNQDIRFCYRRAALSGNFLTCGDIDNVKCQIRQFWAERG